MVEPKTAKSARLIPLTTRAVAALARQREAQDELRRAARVWAENDLVFADSLGQAMWPATVTRKVEDLLRRVVPGMRLHDLRAGYATLLAASGAHPRTAMGLLGHAAVGQSMDYTKVVPAEAVAAARALDEVMG